MAAKELAKVRVDFVDRVSMNVISQLLDVILLDGIVNDGEREAVLEENSQRAERARCLIDLVRRKGDEASEKFIAHIRRRDETLYKELGLSSGQPAQPEPSVKQGRSTTLDPTTDDDDIYPVTEESIRNRVALLITNIKFANEKLNRKGAEEDEKNMEKLLEDFGYEVVKHTNLTGKEMDAALIKFSQHPKLKATDSVVVVIMSHGKRGAVLGVNCKHETYGDDELPIDNIYKHLGSEKCPALLNKPKIIIIQACRGEERRLVLQSYKEDEQPGPSSSAGAVYIKDVAEHNAYNVQAHIHFISLFFFNPDYGSFLVQSIVEVFKSFAKEDITVLFTRVIRCLSVGYGQASSMMTNGLIRHFHFFPGGLFQSLKLKACGSETDSSTWTRLNPEVSRVDGVHIYHQQSEAGRYECSVSALRWVCKEKISFRFKFCSWNQYMRSPACKDYMPAGPLLDITVTAGKMEEIHLPHWICIDQRPTASGTFAVLHADQCGDVVMPVCEVTSAYVKLLQPTFSPIGVMIRKKLGIPVRYDVLIYKTNKEFLTLDIYVVPPETALQEEVERKQNTCGSILIIKPGPDKSLLIGNHYSITTDKEGADIQPKRRELEHTSRNLFECFIRNADGDITLRLQSEKNTVWTCTLHKGDYRCADHEGAASGQHFVDRHFTALIQRVSDTGSIVDKLKEKDLISDNEYDDVRALKTAQSRMRSILRIVAKAGPKAKDAFYDILKSMKNMEYLISDLEGSG